MIVLYGKQNNHWDQAGMLSPTQNSKRGAALIGVAILSEIKAALDSSLEKKAQSLEHDRWMFEGEGKSKGQVVYAKGVNVGCKRYCDYGYWSLGMATSSIDEEYWGADRRQIPTRPMKRE